MSAQLLDGLDDASLLLLQVAVRQEAVAARTAAAPPLEADPEQAAGALVERGLLQEHSFPGVLTLTPLGYALEPIVRDRWDALHAALRERLVDHLTAGGDVSPELARALRATDRADFVPEPARCLVDLDVPLPLGIDDMTTSAPHAIVAILSAVAPTAGGRVLVCGAKGGVTLALAAHLVGPRGLARAIDSSEGIVDHVTQAIAHLPPEAAPADATRVADVTLGWAEHAPYDAIVLNGSVPKIPWPLVGQLAEGGRLLLFLQEPSKPGQSCYVIRKEGGVVRDEALSQFLFTPIYGRFGWDRMDELREGSRQAPDDYST